MQDFDKVKTLSTQVLIQNYVYLIKSHYLLNNYSYQPGLTITHEQVEVLICG